MKVTKKQFKKWTTPNKASYLGLWVGSIGTIFGIASLATAVYFYYYPPRSLPTASDEYIRTTTPTTIKLSSTSFLRWLGDTEKSLTLTYENTSEVTAKNFTVYIKIKGKQLKPFKSVAFRDINMDILSIPSNKKLDLPVIEFSKLQGFFDKTICGVGVNPASSSSCHSVDDITSTQIEVISKFKTVFDEKKYVTSPLWIYTCETCESAGLHKYKLTVQQMSNNS